VERNKHERRKKDRAKRRRRQAQALKRLRSDYFFYSFLKAEQRVGLVGESLNALVLLIVVVSRLLPRPLSAFVKGVSSAQPKMVERTPAQGKRKAGRASKILISKVDSPAESNLV
jgi:hypothetical protein